jgi:hypothetical protein
MNINWVISDRAVLDPTLNVRQLKDLGSFWGSWRTWRACQTDNVICHGMLKADELIKRNFHKTCNFYIPNSVYLNLDRPENVKLYEGDFVHDVDGQEEIVAMHLASSNSDIILLLGFDFSEQDTISDRLLEHRAHNYRSLTKQAISSMTNVQWVVVDHFNKIRPDMLDLPNFSQDTLQNVLTLTV